MKSSEGKALIDSCLKRGWVKHGDKLLTPGEAATLAVAKKKKLPKAKRTGWIDDELNLRNKEKCAHMFIQLVKQELGLEVWPEFYFITARAYRFDFAIPTWSNSTTLKIAIEVDGGIWAKGNSGHSSGRGIKRDMDKSTLANVNGWTLIRRTPDELITNETIELIKTALKTIAANR